jgi:hypothetical protein
MVSSQKRHFLSICLAKIFKKSQHWSQGMTCTFTEARARQDAAALAGQAADQLGHLLEAVIVKQDLGANVIITLIFGDF